MCGKSGLTAQIYRLTCLTVSHAIRHSACWWFIDGMDRKRLFLTVYGATLFFFSPAQGEDTKFCMILNHYSIPSQSQNKYTLV